MDLMTMAIVVGLSLGVAVAASRLVLWSVFFFLTQTPVQSEVVTALSAEGALLQPETSGAPIRTRVPADS